jgi:hypothetical protein
MKYSCINQRLRRITSGIIPSNAYGHLKFEFDFRTDDWNKADVKTAKFYYKGNNYSVDLDENNQCFVPKEVIYAPMFSVSIQGGDITTNYVKNYVEEVKSDIGTVPPSSDGENTSGIVFVPSINEDKILSWTISDGNNIKTPDPVDLNPFDEWTDDGDVISEYEWEEDV